MRSEEEFLSAIDCRFPYADEQLGKSGTVLTGMPAMTAEQVITGILINHIDDHYGSIRKTVGA